MKQALSPAPSADAAHGNDLCSYFIYVLIFSFNSYKYVTITQMMYGWNRREPAR